MTTDLCQLNSSQLLQVNQADFLAQDEEHLFVLQLKALENGWWYNEAQQIKTTLVRFQVVTATIFNTTHNLILDTWSETRAGKIFINVVRVSDSYREWRCEMKERTSCLWSPCENGCVTENRLLPCHCLPEQSTLRGQGSSWWTTLKCLNCLRFSSSFIFCMTSLISFIYSPIDWLLMDEWIAEYLSSPALAFSSTCTERLLCSPLVDGATAVWVFVFVCLWTANTDEQKPRPQNTKLPHNVADNYHDNILGLKGDTRQNGCCRKTLQCYRNLANEALFLRGYGLLVWSIPV